MFVVHVSRFPTARWRPEAARPNPALGARPCRAAEISELEHLRVQSLPQPDQDRPSAEATRQRLLGHQPPCCRAATFPVFQGFETQAEDGAEGEQLNQNWAGSPVPARPGLWAKGRLASGQGSCSLPLD